ncbi:MAG: Ig domain protein group 1 domain protein, partial [Parcubacteria group bacterium GW2011_GWF2_50_9]
MRKKQPIRYGLGIAAYTLSWFSLLFSLFPVSLIVPSIAEAVQGTTPLTVTAGSPSATTSTVSANPTSVTADGTTTSTITVTVKDTYSNLVSGATVTLSSSRGATDTIVQPVGTTDASGQITGTVKSTTSGDAVISAVVNGTVNVTATATVTFTAGPPAASTSLVDALPTSVVADGVTTSTITVTVLDANNNPVSGATVSLSSSRGATDTITQPVGTTNA